MHMYIYIYYIYVCLCVCVYRCYSETIAEVKQDMSQRRRSRAELNSLERRARPCKWMLVIKFDEQFDNCLCTLKYGISDHKLGSIRRLENPYIPDRHSYEHFNRHF